MGADKRHDPPHLRRRRRTRRRDQPRVDVLVWLSEQAFQGVEFAVVEPVQGVGGEAFESDSLWLVAGAHAAPFEGDLDDYRRWLSERPAVMFVRDEAAGSRPSGTVATGGVGTAAESPPSGTVATGGPGMAVRAAGECLPPAGADPFGGSPLTGDPRSGSVTPSGAATAPDRRRIAPLRREIDSLERRLAALGEERASTEATLADTAVYDEAQRPWLRGLLVRRGRLDAEIAEVESLWLEKSEQLDAMRGLAACASQGAE